MTAGQEKLAQVRVKRAECDAAWRTGAAALGHALAVPPWPWRWREHHRHMRNATAWFTRAEALEAEIAGLARELR